MNDRQLLVIGSVGIAIAAPCCFTPVWVVSFGAVGHSVFFEAALREVACRMTSVVVGPWSTGSKAMSEVCSRLT